MPLSTCYDSRFEKKHNIPISSKRENKTAAQMRANLPNADYRILPELIQETSGNTNYATYENVNNIMMKT